MSSALLLRGRGDANCDALQLLRAEGSWEEVAQGRSKECLLVVEAAGADGDWLAGSEGVCCLWESGEGRDGWEGTALI